MTSRPVTWLGQTIVNTTTLGQQEGARITQLANGNILLAWEQQAQSGAGAAPGTDIIGRIFNPLGQPVTGEFRLNNASTAFDEEQASLAALPDGGFVVAYRVVKDRAYSDLRIEEYDANGTQVSEASLIRSDPSAAPPNYGSPHVAVAPSGAVLVTWLKQNADGSVDVEARMYDPATNAGGPVFTVNTACRDESPAVVSLASGGFVVASVSAGGGVTHTRIAADGTLGTSATISAGGREVEDPSATALANGGYVLAWTGTGADQTPRTFFYGVTPAGTFSGTAGPGNDPQVTALPGGGFLIVQAAGTMQAARYTDTGALVGTYAFGTFGFLGGVVTLADGRVAVAWQSGDINMEILDLRDGVGAVAHAGWQVGTTRADVFTSAALARVVAAWDGDDVVREGGRIATSFRLGDGNDRMIVTSTLDGDAFRGAAGIDRIDWSRSSADGVTFDLAQGLASKGRLTERMTGFENLTGTQNRDIILGTQGANLLDGLAGSDVLQGRGGADTLRGGGGADVITGGGGRDRLTGGTGADDFVFANTAHSSTGPLRDVITDFTIGQDDLILAAIDANTSLSGDQRFAFDTGGTFAVAEIRQTQVAAGLLISLNTDNDAAAELTILLTGVTDRLTVTDILF